MKCEICHENDAKTAIRVMSGGKEKELYVCRECAEKEKDKGRKRQNRRRTDRPTFDDWDSPDWSANPFFDDDDDEELIDRKSGGNGHRHWTLAEDVAPCPDCGTTIEDLEHTSLLGCPYCYTAFKEVLAREVRLGGAFAGKVPKRRGGAQGKSAGAGEAKGDD